MDFESWLMAQTKRNDPVGDLAREYVRECSCGREHRAATADGLRAVMDQHGADPGAYEALERAEGEFRALER